MRIVSLKEFLKQPQGTIFATCQTLDWSELMVFHRPIGPGEGIQGDFEYADIHTSSAVDFPCSMQVMHAVFAAEKDSSIRLPLTTERSSRYGLHTSKTKFVVYDEEDVMKIMEALAKSLSDTTLRTFVAKLGHDLVRTPPALSED